MQDHYHVLVVGGGTAGLTVAALLRNRANPPAVAIIEPSAKHYYQPLWTLVGGGVFPREVTERDEAEFIPPGATWIHDAVVTFDPAQRAVTTEGERVVTYDQLVVAPGVQLDWGKIPGLQESVGRPGTGVVSNYAYETVSATWEAIRSFRGGTAIFTEPKTPVKCGGAPQKIMYLAEETFRKNGVADRSRVVFANAKAVNFTSPAYATTLMDICRARGIDVQLEKELVAVHADRREAVFRLKDGVEETMHYDMIHVTPPQSAPDFVKRSPLANADGWVDVDKHTLAHARWPGVWGLGDASSLPTSKTGAAIRKQAPVVVENIIAAIEGRPAAARYDGYTACPVVTGYGKLIMAEFDYTKEPAESFP